jgi:hypothetical protein
MFSLVGFIHRRRRSVSSRGFITGGGPATERDRGRGDAFTNHSPEPEVDSERGFAFEIGGTVIIVAWKPRLCAAS